MSTWKFGLLLLAVLPLVALAQDASEEDEDDDSWSLVLALVVVIVSLALLAICLIVVICEIRTTLADTDDESEKKTAEIELFDASVQTDPWEETRIEVFASAPPTTSSPSVEEDLIAFQRILDGLYNLTQQSIYGRHATVIKASMVTTPRDVVVKVHDRVGPCLHEHAFYTSFDEEGSSSMMYDEAKSFIPELIDAGQITLSDKSCPALVLEAGLFSLKEFLTPKKGVPRYVVLSDKSTFFQICNSLRFIHGKGYAHGDLHVGSVMFFGSRWKLIDFSSWGSDEKEMVCTSTSHYTAPEVIQALARGRRTMQAAQAADIWALGAIAWELLTKKPLLSTSDFTEGDVERMSFGEIQFPWEGKPAQFWNEIKSQAAAKIIQNCLQRDPLNRWNIDRVISYMKFWSE